MIRFAPRTLVSVAVLLLLLFALNLYLQRNHAVEYSSTSFGVGQDGYKAAYDLLRALHFPVNRAYFRSDRTPSGRTLWFVLPDYLYSDDRAAKADAADLMKWVRAGGTAVVFGDSGGDWGYLGLDATEAAGNDQGVQVEGAISRSPRDIPIDYVNYFDKVDPNARILLSAYGDPVAFELKEGAGRLIAVSDARFLQNWCLDQGDSSLLVVDLVRAFGAPDFDEHCHGLAAPRSAPGLFENPRLLALIGFMLLTAMLWIAEQHSWPRRKLDDQPEGPSPSIVTFVESLGRLYARSNEPRAAFGAYRSSFLRRARQSVSPRLEISEQAVLERLTRERSIPEESKLWLTGEKLPATESELVEAVRALESCSIQAYGQHS